MTTIETQTSAELPVWEAPSFYTQSLEAIAAQTAALRREAPVHWYEPAGSWLLPNNGFWVLSKWEDERMVESTPELFSNRFGSMMGDANDPSRVIDQLPAWAGEELAKPGLTLGDQRGILQRAKMSIGGRRGTESFHVLDPPAHGEVRGIFMKALRPSRVRKLPEFINGLIDERMKDVEAGTTVDFTAAVSTPVPPALMCEMIGVPPEMWGPFAEWADALLMVMAMDPNRDEAEVAHLTEQVQRYSDYIEELQKEREASGDTEGEDLFSVIARSELNGKPLTPTEVIRMVNALISGGAHTSAHLISWTMYALATHPDQLALVREQPELINNAIEEVLRFYPIVWHDAHTALADTEIRGTAIRKGDFLLSSFMSANRDEEVWERPDEFDITRSFDAGHLAFGYGHHSCPGAQLTKVEVATVLQNVFARYSSWKLAGDPVWLHSQFLNGILSLPLVFEE